MSGAGARVDSAENSIAAGITKRPLPATIALLLCLALFAGPTLLTIATTAWTTEEGAHGPIVALIGVWLLARALPAALRSGRRPNTGSVAILAGLVLPAFVVARIGGIVELEGYLVYLGLVTVLYALIGAQALAHLWFPLIFLPLALPPPDSLVALATQPLKIAVSRGAVSLLDLAGYPVGGEGVHIYIGQYELLVAEACSGLNSLVALIALTMLYVHLRRQAGPGQMLLFVALAIPLAALANLVRVIALILLTYHGGEAIGQGFLHDFAGLTTFLAALLLLIAIDAALPTVRAPRLRGRPAPVGAHP